MANLTFWIQIRIRSSIRLLTWSNINKDWLRFWVFLNVELEVLFTAKYIVLCWGWSWRDVNLEMTVNIKVSDKMLTLVFWVGMFSRRTDSVFSDRIRIYWALIAVGIFFRIKLWQKSIRVGCRVHLGMFSWMGDRNLVFFDRIQRYWASIVARIFSDQTLINFNLNRSRVKQSCGVHP